MAIKIPSKHIYSMDNPKVRDNFIDKVEMTRKKVLPHNENKANVFNNRYDGLFIANTNESYERQNVIQNIPLETDSVNNPVYYIRVSYASIIPIYFTTDVEIPIHFGNSFISNLVLQEKDDNGNKYATSTYTVYGIIEQGNFEQKFSVTYDSTPLNEGNRWQFLETNKKFTQTSISPYTELINIQDIDNCFKRKEIQQISNKDDLVADLSENYIRNETNLNSITSSIDYDNDCFKIKGVKLCVGATSIGGTFGERATLSKSGGTYTGTITGTYTKYIPTYIEFNIYGNTVGIKLEDNTVSFGTGNKPFSLDGNELLQDSATTNGKLTTQHLAENILAQYKNGKETATILCDIGEYYNQQGEKAISTIDSSLPMTFKIGDEVIPYVYGADGQDHPMYPRHRHWRYK
jgi:hypothetical protein